MADVLHPSMLELSQTISDRTAKIDQLLKSKKLPPPSFAADAPSPDFVPDDEPELRKLRDELMVASKQIYDLVIGPKLAWINFLMLQVGYLVDLRAPYLSSCGRRTSFDTEPRYVLGVALIYR